MLRPKRVKLLCAVFFILGASLTLLLVTFALSLFIHHFGGQSVSQILARTRSGTTTAPEKRGAWGVLEPVELPLANTDGVFPDQAERLQNPKWFFERFTESSLSRFLSSCDLRPVERRILLDKRSWDIGTNGVSITPPEQLVWSLTHHARQQIYAALAKSTANYPQCFPFRFPLNSFDLKFKDSGLPIEQLNRIKRLTYTNDTYLCFSDLESVKRVLKPEDFKDLIETLYIIPSYLLRLRISPDSDIEALVKYWGKGGREKRIAPILTSLSKVPGGASMNISSLLPTFARLRLYTYPEAWNDATASQQDCFFTAINFFNETPDTNFFDSVYSRRVLKSEYEPVNDDPGFGDVIALFNDQGDAIHTCVYIADDFVFTKNGINAAQPWVLMRLADMLLIYYNPEKTGRALFLRRKNL